MSIRPSILLVAAVAIALAGCVASPAGTADPTPGTDAPVGSTPPDRGDVEGGYPELTVEAGADGVLVVSVTDPFAKAWRVVVAGEGQAADHRLEFIVETGDVEPTVLVREIDAGVIVDEVNLTGVVGDPTTAAGGCHRILPVCYASEGFVLPAGDGTLSLALQLVAPGPALRFVGSSADWPGEPFVLGPWRETEAFVADAG